MSYNLSNALGVLGVFEGGHFHVFQLLVDVVVLVPQRRQDHLSLVVITFKKK